MDNMQTEYLSIDKYKVTVCEIMPILYKHWTCNEVQKDRLHLHVEKLSLAWY